MDAIFVLSVITQDSSETICLTKIAVDTEV